MPTAHFNIGSNLGNRLAIIGKAVALLEWKTGVSAKVSAPVISDSWGYDSPNRFVNVGVCLHSDLSPRQLLNLALEVEREIDPGGSHRTPSGGYSDRLIDVDLICVDSTVSDSDPVLPHPRMHLREFVLAPLAELMPEWRHPLLGMNPNELLAALHTKTT